MKGTNRKPFGEGTMKNSMALVTLLCLLVFTSGRSPKASNAVHADESQTTKWTKMEIPLKVGRLDSRRWKYVTAQGYWQSTSENKDKQLLSPIAVKISCDGGE